MNSSAGNKEKYEHGLNNHELDVDMVELKKNPSDSTIY